MSRPTTWWWGWACFMAGVLVSTLAALAPPWVRPLALHVDVLTYDGGGITCPTCGTRWPTMTLKMAGLICYCGGWIVGTCRHCGDGTEIGDDPARELCIMCAKAGRS